MEMSRSRSMLSPHDLSSFDEACKQTRTHKSGQITVHSLFPVARLLNDRLIESGPNGSYLQRHVQLHGLGRLIARARSL